MRSVWRNPDCVRGTLQQNPLAPGSTPAAPGLWGGEGGLVFTQHQQVTWHRRVGGESALKARPGQQQPLRSGPGGEPGGAQSAAPGTGHLPPACCSEMRGGDRWLGWCSPSPRKDACLSRRSPGGGQWAACSPSSSLLPSLCVLCLFLPSLLKPHGFPGSFQAKVPKCSSPESQCAWP